MLDGHASFTGKLPPFTEKLRKLSPAVASLYVNEDERQDNMAAPHEKFWTEDIIAAAILAASGGTTLLLTKLRAIALEQHLPFLHTLAQWWPLLLIVGGVILLFTNQIEIRQRRAASVISRSYTEKIHGFRN